MPRGRKTQSGAPAQPATAPKGQTYGTGEAAVESQRRMPVPDFASQGPGGPAAAPGVGPATQAPGVNPEELQQMLQGVMGPSVFAEPTERPDEPVTQGLAGAANVTRPMPDEGLYELRAIAQRFPYPALLELLRRAEDAK